MNYINMDALLTMLKANLEIITDYMDADAASMKDLELTGYIGAAIEFITREGITLADTIGDATLITMYAGWLYERRKAGDGYGAMPRMLRYNLNNRLFTEHVSGVPGVTCE